MAAREAQSRLVRVAGALVRVREEFGAALQAGAVDRLDCFPYLTCEVCDEGWVRPIAALLLPPRARHAGRVEVRPQPPHHHLGQTRQELQGQTVRQVVLSVMNSPCALNLFDW